MSILTIIGILFAVFGLLILSIRIGAYNKRKYSNKNKSSIWGQITGAMNIYRILSIILIVIALGIFYFLRE